MSFRRRLSVFFTIIVVVPMVAVALVLFSLTSDSETGKSDARIAEGLQVALALYEEKQQDARPALMRVVRDPALGRALAAGRAPAVQARARRLARTTPGVAAIVLEREGREVARAGTPSALAYATAAPTTPEGRRVGTLGVSVTTAKRLARDVQRRVRLDVRIAEGNRVVASTLPEKATRDDTGGRVKIRGDDYRGRFEEIDQQVGPVVRLGVFEQAEKLGSSVSESRLLIGGILLAFLLLSLASSVFVVRALQGQVDQFLQAAKRLGKGDFSGKVPIQGSDEFAALGEEFNEMAQQLEAKIEEVEGKRRELEASIRRVGDAFAAGLDRQGIVDLAMETAVTACAAASGRAVPLDKRRMKAAEIGEKEADLAAAMDAAEHEAFRLSPEEEPRIIEREIQGVSALAVPLRARTGADDDRSEFVGVISIARRQDPFTESERGMFAYLAGQAAVSIENADLHATVQEQAVTDALTGLHNRRQFRETLDTEIERSRRFGSDTGLLMLDIDDFKQVNDKHGHQQGDLVLKAVALVLIDLSRDIDGPARYGGEEMAVVLPQTDTTGAQGLAERMRTAIDALEIERLDGGGTMGITASFGVASLPSSADGRDELIAAADGALYKAKRAGKNRVERAAAAPATTEPASQEL